MYEVVYMKADFEPWWMFEEWRDFTISAKTFPNKIEMQEYVSAMVIDMKTRYEHYETRKGCFHAFWSPSEKHYCDGCEGDLQIYHGLIVLVNDQPDIS
ncbi:DUF1033 family protein [Mammaliicoccus sciuri]|uniref:DUF1033 family protein n=2 Tax=Sporosarcina newyorkensis TaxID=759851 RepID=A0A1T4XIK8_9BACL|nr:DUF1033 family protein [Sporosarcina newyorkensis]EGQ27803.1 hypothetical protein HMPREF9372_0138 [Sporosarcina newyorkensis 2681]SKA89364.1 hypothetical protein SAMN04244570_0830 [Sporosarcina newyorkensis]